ncbi:glycoside hydrolase family 15 protein [Xylophilus sp. GOD-11R]|uniref:glycoside hydrolase family 15 protein n=1 Tax=Xylophilus sp. GOD-11R TaxID=3089814 RepID=UPI00298C5330|nr:glycoside hydrolase family 15 protein [Xylophilus sp. GOD-11R]WPB55588.1 glycoside hydrolase family 15 protein [Xylophilus sp. GOD-11R]
MNDRALVNSEAFLRPVVRTDGYLPLERYGVLGDGRAIALSGADGSIDWWCVPNLDSPPLFNRLLDPEDGGFFQLLPRGEFSAEQRYREDSNVLETLFTTSRGRARMTESLNSGTAGRLPWAELARRVEGLEGEVEFDLQLLFGRRANAVSPYQSKIGTHATFHVDRVLGVFVHSDGVRVERSDEGVQGGFAVRAGGREVVGIVAGEDEPLVVPSVQDIDDRIEVSDQEWKTWASRLSHGTEWRPAFLRSALALKLLLYSPTGAIAAAGTTSLPEGVGGAKNYDYRFAWVRDAGYTVKAFLAAGAQAEAKAAFTWLLKRLEEHGPLVCFTLAGGRVQTAHPVDVPGYRRSQPVQIGNDAATQRQHGVFGDIFETAARFVNCGNILDSSSAHLLSRLADQCADSWRQKDSGIWELPEPQHYTNSKISCWQALARAVELADGGQLPTTCRDRWCRERDRIERWIEENCWSPALQSYLAYPGSDQIDAALAMAVRFGYPGRERLGKTLDAIDRQLGSGAFHYRYSGVHVEEGCFLACTFWMVEARVLLGQRTRGEHALRHALAGLDHGVGVFTEMIDPHDGAFAGNLPQGLSHLALIMALDALGNEDCGDDRPC